MAPRKLSTDCVFAFGTFTRIPVPAPRQLSTRTTAWGICLAPLVGLVLGLVAEALSPGDSLADSRRGRPTACQSSPSPPSLALSGGIHLDGLTDTADGLASGADSDGAPCHHATVRCRCARRRDVGVGPAPAGGRAQRRTPCRPRNAFAGRRCHGVTTRDRVGMPPRSTRPPVLMGSGASVIGSVPLHCSWGSDRRDDARHRLVPSPKMTSPVRSSSTHRRHGLGTGSGRRPPTLLPTSPRRDHRRRARCHQRSGVPGVRVCRRAALGRLGLAIGSTG